ncbi:T9SS type A sorting domain-containing protein [Hymenobacter cellulosivorans]|uniref:T9SS type A sorting domain-containing protein n=1 Tax=Hymenobacter cellulosivorans TaxID=2932249 RepID=A0ABY4F7D6_9BACT|nr:T9SS type A sorting domain-containing protein [Hymenobacter cellulosivorans]UOQ52017.1 T9SS type A sorting domain-containing protein [Hymenobacter cellulosivorans]
MKSMVTLLCAWLLTGTAALAQWQTLNVTNSPLHSNVVREVAIDSDGSQWIATQRALQHLSGTTWTTFTAANGLPSSNVVSLAVRNGIVWVGTDKGLSRFDGTTWTYFNDPTKLPVGRFGGNDLTITELVISSTGTVWMAGSRGIARFDGITWTKFNSSNSSLKEEAVTSLALDETVNMLWIGTNCNSTNSGLYGLNTLNFSFRYHKLTGNNCVHGVAVNNLGAVVIGTCNTSMLLTLDNGWLSTPTPSSCVALGGMAPDPSNPARVWVATESFGTAGTAPRGLLVYDSNSNTVVQQFNMANSALPTNLLSSVALQQTGGRLKVWVGTADQGLAVYETVVTAQRAPETKLALTMVPNPASATVEVRADLPRYALTVYDTAGRLLHQEQVLGRQSVQLAVQSWPRGLYHVRLTAGEEVRTGHFSKE